MSQPSPITDSPWLWFALFSAVSLVALLATGGKFGKRQATIERKGQARTAIMEGLQVDVDSTGRKSAAAAPTYSQPGETRVRLMPLAITLGLVLLASLGLLARERLTPREPST
jgi:hypothetical protein